MLNRARGAAAHLDEPLRPGQRASAPSSCGPNVDNRRRGEPNSLNLMPIQRQHFEVRRRARALCR